MARAEKNLAVVIPMFNEEMNAERCVRCVSEVLQSKLPDVTLYIVDDGSKDATPRILADLEAKSFPLKVVTHPVNKGYGAALLTGARRALDDGFEYALFMDSDLTNDPELIPTFAALAAEGRYDVIKASRYVKGGGMRGVPLYHRAVTIVGNKIAALLFGMGIHDCTNGFRAVRLRLLSGLNFSQNGFPVIAEELYLLKTRKALATEFPYILTARKKNEGKSKFRYRPQLFYNYLKYAIKAAFV